MGEIQESLRTTNVGWEIKVGMRTLIVERYVPVKHICNGCYFHKTFESAKECRFSFCCMGHNSPTCEICSEVPDKESVIFKAKKIR